MTVVFNIISICSREMRDERVDTCPTFCQDLPIFFSDGDTRAIVGGQILITTHDKVVGGEEEE